MAEYLPVILTALICTLTAAVVVLIQNAKHEKQLRKLERRNEDSYSRGLDDASSLLRETCDSIETEKQRLAVLSDRELLLEILLALGSCGRRMDRMEEKLRLITHYRDYLDDIRRRTAQMTQNYVLLEKDISDAASLVRQFQNTVCETADGISTLIEQLSAMETLPQTVSRYIGQLEPLQQTLEGLQRNTSALVADMNTVLDTHDQAPMKKLKTIEMEITGLSLLVNTLQETMSEMTEETAHIRQQLETASCTGDTGS